MATEPKETVKETPPAGSSPPKAAASDRMSEDKKRVAHEREERAKQAAERYKNRGTPTPTQEEMDMIKLGHHVELANDGSGPDPNEARNTVKHIGGKHSDKPSEYPTRQMSAKA